LSELFSLAGKTAVVTGGSRGIGLMIARGFVEAGVRVYITSRKAEVCEAVAAELSAKGACFAVPGDLSTEAECARVAGVVAEREERIDILVNNAGANWSTPLMNHDEKSWDRTIDLNLKGAFFMTKHLLSLLQAAGTAEEPARIINIGSIDGIRATELETYSYSASKAAVHQLTRDLARHLAPTIAVNAIAPGPFQSKMMAATLEARGDEIAASVPLQRIGRPDDLAGTAIYLASRASAFLTGVVIPVDGGTTTLKG
jgi:NAD(P)-dependent dehydrogenase (short-subunit alcohol dehydrogenase family)